MNQIYHCFKQQGKSLVKKEEDPFTWTSEAEE